VSVAAARRDAAERAARQVESGMVVGLGSGATAALAVRALARRLRTGELRGIVGVPTSETTRRLAAAARVTLTTLERRPAIDLTIDGADEVTRAGDMLKGGGGALLREKIVARASRRLLIVIDPAKRSARLGSRHPLPIVVVPFGWTRHLELVRSLGGEPALRRAGRGRPFRTDDGHFILDATFAGGIAHPAELAARLRSSAGVVETGLFLGYAPEVIVGRMRTRMNSRRTREAS
jgi:ribose 5-phosphate isomerase A